MSSFVSIVQAADRALLRDWLRVRWICQDNFMSCESVVFDIMLVKLSMYKKVKANSAKKGFTAADSGKEQSMQREGARFCARKYYPSNGRFWE